MNEFEEYRKTATVEAKLFEKGDEDGMIAKGDLGDVLTDVKNGIEPDKVPFIRTLENQFHKGEFGKHYLLIGIDGERWLVENDIFKRTYERTKKKSSKEFLKSKGLKDTLYNVNYNPNQNRGLPQDEWIKGGLSKLLDEFLQQT